MNFLKKLASVLLKAVGIVAGLEPLVQPYLGSNAGMAKTVVNDFTQIAQVVVQAETILTGVNGSDADKIAAAVPLVANIVKTSELVAGKKIADDALFIKGCQEITQGVADILSAIHPDEVKV